MITQNKTLEPVMRKELITPETAAEMLKNNKGNRNISKGTVVAYAQDMAAGAWDEDTGATISIDYNGVLRDGQHRLAAIIKSGTSLNMWVCRGVSPDGIYDNNRKRSISDQIMISRPDIEPLYRNSRYICVVRAILQHNSIGSRGGSRRVVTPKEIIDFTDKHKKDLDGFFLNMPQNTAAGISLAVVYLAMFMAYMKGVELQSLLSFYDVLCSGMSTGPADFPIIAYRNYLLRVDVGKHIATIEEIGRCQYAINKYLEGSCVKTNRSIKKLIWPFPFEEVEDE